MLERCDCCGAYREGGDLVCEECLKDMKHRINHRNQRNEKMMEEELLKMSVNARCVGCKEPTKFVAGFYDGPRGEHGCFYDCENEACAVNQILRCAESKEAQKMMQIQEDNGRLGMYAGEIAALRKDVGLTIMQMSQMVGCSPAEYSAYEHERKKFDPEVYRKCKGYLHERRVKNGTINE